MDPETLTNLSAYVGAGLCIGLGAVGAAIGEGFVVVLNSRGEEVGRVLTSSNGHFSFTHLAPGQYRLRSERIGYRARETDLL